jgi:cbb3-type cytochrome oxidase maturation protein
MSVGARLLLFWVGSAALIALALFIWGRRSGQFRDIEEAKYRMLEDREPEPWPGRNGSPKGRAGDSGADATGAGRRKEEVR